MVDKSLDMDKLELLRLNAWVVADPNRAAEEIHRLSKELEQLKQPDFSKSQVDKIFERVCEYHGFKSPHKKADALYWMNEAVVALNNMGYIKQRDMVSKIRGTIKC